MRPLFLSAFSLCVGCGPLWWDDTTTYETVPAAPAQTTVSASVTLTAPPNTVSDVGVFYEELDPYGTWMDTSAYGRVFYPSDPGYVPYQDGHWSQTEYGTTWVSAPSDPIGWAVCHYGRWIFVGRWAWIPDTTWGPSWVDWREADTVVGWAPMAPVGVGIPDRSWVYCPSGRLFDRGVRSHFLGWRDVRRVHVRARPVRHRVRSARGTVWVAGPGEPWFRRNRVRVRPRRYASVRVRPVDRGRGATVRVRDDRPSVAVRDGRPVRRRDRPSVAVRGPERQAAPVFVPERQAVVTPRDRQSQRELRRAQAAAQAELARRDAEQRARHAERERARAAREAARAEQARVMAANAQHARREAERQARAMAEQQRQAERLRIQQLEQQRRAERLRIQQAERMQRENEAARIAREQARMQQQAQQRAQMEAQRRAQQEQLRLQREAQQRAQMETQRRAQQEQLRLQQQAHRRSRVRQLKRSSSPAAGASSVAGASLKSIIVPSSRCVIEEVVVSSMQAHRRSRVQSLKSIIVSSSRRIIGRGRDR